MMFSGILIDIQITFDKSKRRYRKYASGILIDILIIFKKRNQDVYGIFRYSHRHSNNLR